MELSPVKLKRELKSRINEYRRVLKIASKPDREEFEMSAKITGAGILLIGAIGFLFYIANNMIPILLSGAQ